MLSTHITGGGGHLRPVIIIDRGKIVADDRAERLRGMQRRKRR